MRYKVGDTVVLKENLIVGAMYGSVRFSDKLKPLTGKKVIIRGMFPLSVEHQYALIIDDGLFISEFMINHCYTAELNEKLKEEDRDESVTLEFHMGEKVTIPTKNKEYRVNIRQKSGRVYQFKMDGTKLKKIMDMLHLRRGGSFVEIDNQLINVHEAEHVEYFEV